MSSKAKIQPVKNRTDIGDWRPDDDAFWDSTGHTTAYRNLWISVPSLLAGFAIWMMWGILTVQMLNLGFPFSKEDMFSLTAISGLAGQRCVFPPRSLFVLPVAVIPFS